MGGKSAEKSERPRHPAMSGVKAKVLDLDCKDSETRLAESRVSRVRAFAECSPRTLALEELIIHDSRIDPCRPSLKQQLVERMCAGRPAGIQRMAAQHGGLNMGVWLLTDACQDLVVKMVTNTRFMGLPTEAEVFLDLARRYPQLMDDMSIAFPIKIFGCSATDGTRRDLIVMRRAKGECFANVMAKKLDDGRVADLLQDLESFGRFLAGFHARHGLQHGDCQPANVIFDEASQRFSLIDVADIASPNIKKTDVEHFAAGILSIAKRHGQGACEDLKRYFSMGYAKAS